MNKEFVISDEVLDKVRLALMRNENWMVFNNSLYFVDPQDVNFFETEENAKEFCENNYSDHDSFSTLYVESPEDLLKQISYGSTLDEQLDFISQKGRFLNELKTNLTELGFSERLFPAIEFYLKNQQETFQLIQRERSENEKVVYELHFENTNNYFEYCLKDYKASLMIAPEIPDVTINGINVRKLDEEMKSVDWSIDHHAESLVHEYMETLSGNELLDKIGSVLRNIDELYNDGGAGKDAAEKLIYKHWVGEPWQPNTISVEHLKKQFEWKVDVVTKGHRLQPKQETYIQLKTAALKDLEQLNKHSITNQSFFMNEQNLQYLKDNIKYLGFGEKLYPELEKNIQQGFPEFQLKIQTEYNKDKISAVLHFKKSENSDMYFFNRYNATLEKTNGDQLDHTFYLNKGNGVTTKEAYNLLNGRSVFKDLTNSDGQKYNAWIQLDLKNKDDNGNYKTKQFHENYGYDLEKALKQYPIKELDEVGSNKMLLRSLEKGNMQSVTFEMEGSTSKMFIEANPQYKTINVYDGQMKPVQKEAVEQYRLNQHSENKNMRTGTRQESKENGENKKKELAESKKNSKSVKSNKQDSLLPKKRRSTKKGLSLS